MLQRSRKSHWSSPRHDCAAGLFSVAIFALCLGFDFSPPLCVKKAVEQKWSVNCNHAELRVGRLVKGHTDYI